MCGFLGIISPGGAPAHQQIVREGLRLLAHRGPDDEGHHITDNWALGHRRLAVFDTTSAGRQPFSKGGCHLVFNGAIYNFRELRTELVQLGHTFTTQTDTEVILAAYLSWGEACVQRFNGMWAFAIVDETRNILFCSRDRFGIKPFYYWSSAAIPFAFASEIKAFQALRAWRAILNGPRAFEYLVYGWQDHTAETLFRGVQQLPPGTNLRLELKSTAFELTPYYQLPQIALLRPTDISIDEAAARIVDLLRDSVQLRLRSDVPNALTLSGGLDSSSIAGLSRELVGPSKDIQSFSALFSDPHIDETKFVDAVGQRNRLSRHTLTPSSIYCWQHYDRILYQQDEPFSSAAIPAHFELMELVQANQYTVLLNGQGADEIFAGYDKFYGPWFKAHSWLMKPVALWQMSRQGILRFDRLKTHFLHRKQQYPLLLSPGFRIDPAQQFSRSADSNLRKCSEHLLREVGFPVMLHYEDRNAMAMGIEMRTPFLDYRLVEFALSLPDAYKLQNGQRKYLLKQAMQAYLPPNVRERIRKLGFATPQNRWMDENRAAIRQQLAKGIQTHVTIFSPALTCWTAEVLDRRQYHHYPFIWRIFSFVRWLDVFALVAD